MANAYNYSNTAIQTTLGGNISGAATSMTVAATTGFPSTTPYVLAVDYGAATEELVVVTGVAGTTLTVTRGFSGTSAQSHSLGAVVRHVVNAQDLIDFRTHEDAAADVHGVTGALVGATSTQTLTNKTLTSPTINGGAMSGTFTGTHTYSGAVTLSGGGALSGTFTGTPTFSGAVVLSGTPSISTGAALAGTFSGTPDFSGNLTFSGTPTFNNQALGRRTFVSGATWRTSVTGDATDRFYVEAGGKHQWGDGTAAVDTTLYRSAAGTLKTDGSLQVTGDVVITGTVSADNIRAGQDQTPAPGSGGGTTTVNVVFSSPMSGTPRVTLTPNSTVDPDPSTGVEIYGYADNVSSTGFTIRCYRSSNSATNWMWIAVVEE